jgi:hypothetical protein
LHFCGYLHGWDGDAVKLDSLDFKLGFWREHSERIWIFADIFMIRMEMQSSSNAGSEKLPFAAGQSE